jgi:hypothetical protein
MADEVVSTPAEATPSASATPVATPQVTAPQSATPAATSAPTTGAPSESRDGWVPSYRVRETREQAQREAQAQFEQRENGYKSELARIQQQLHALVGVQPPQNPEIAQVKTQFSQLYPGLAQLEERAEQLQQMIERAGDIEAQGNHYWQTYGRQTMDRLFDHASTSLGSPLTEEGKRQLHSSFVGFVQSSPELTERYSNDPTIVEDFWKVFTSSFIDPARRAASATVQTRTGTAIPQDRGGVIAPVSPGPKPANLDERANQAWALYQQSKRPGSA